MSDYLSVYVTTASVDEAKAMARSIVNERLAPCANIFPNLHSLYRWQDKVVETFECGLIFKIPAAGFEALSARIREIHSYECPCIIAWPIVDGSPNYLEWLNNT